MWLDTLLVPLARSPRSSTATEKRLRAASRATPRPTMPPPTTTRSSGFTCGRLHPNFGHARSGSLPSLAVLSSDLFLVDGLVQVPVPGGHARDAGDLALLDRGPGPGRGVLHHEVERLLHAAEVR